VRTSAARGAGDYFTHSQARSPAYRAGEDGIAGISDEDRQLCVAMAMWNGNDPILKERLFGLTDREGNHGEDVKEYYFYLENTPTHSYMKYLYKYPQRAFPYENLEICNERRTLYLLPTIWFRNTWFSSIDASSVMAVEDGASRGTPINLLDKSGNILGI
jgi:hypothetical protein